jgi:hypothetical protein
LLEASAQDDVLDPFDLIVTRMFADTTRKGREARLCILRDFGAAALTLSKVCTLVLDGAVAHGDLRILKEDLLWVQTFESIEDLRQALLAFRKTYNTTWPIKHHGFLMPARFSPEAASNRRHRCVGFNPVFQKPRAVQSCSPFRVRDRPAADTVSRQSIFVAACLNRVEYCP